MVDDRESDEDGGTIVIFPLTMDMHKEDKSHPDHLLERRVGALIDWLRVISLVYQLG